MSKKIFKTGIYARLSREDADGGQSNSIQSQRAICRAANRGIPFSAAIRSSSSSVRPNSHGLSVGMVEFSIDLLSVRGSLAYSCGRISRQGRAANRVPFVPAGGFRLCDSPDSPARNGKVCPPYGNASPSYAKQAVPKSKQPVLMRRGEYEIRTRDLLHAMQAL